MRAIGVPVSGGDDVLDPRTRCAQGTRSPDRERVDVGAPLSPVVVPATAFEFVDQAQVDRRFDGEAGWLYARYGSPTVDDAERFVAALEGAEACVSFASGMAAVATVMLTLSGAGRTVAVQRELYGGTVEIASTVLPALGIAVRWIERDEVGSLEASRLDGCDLLWIETPVNPTLRVVDVQAAARACSAAGVPLVVDGTFATPIAQRSLALGASLSMHSATKYMGGHGDLTAGVVSGPARLVDRVRARRRVLGGILGPFNAFLLHRGLRTLALRIEACSATATRIAGHLARHERVLAVNHPSLPGHPDAATIARQMSLAGGMLSFRVAGGAAAAHAVHDRLRLFARVGTLGGIESSVSVPARMSHRHLEAGARRAAGIADDLLRLSIGLERAEDLIEDLERALAGAGG